MLFNPTEKVRGGEDVHNESEIGQAITLKILE